MNIRGKEDELKFAVDAKTNNECLCLTSSPGVGGEYKPIGGNNSS